MHLFVNFGWFFIFQCFGNTHVASLWWICYQQILDASTAGTGSQNLLECSNKPWLSTHIWGGRSAMVAYKVLIPSGFRFLSCHSRLQSFYLGLQLELWLCVTSYPQMLAWLCFLYEVPWKGWWGSAPGESVTIRSCLWLPHPSLYLEMQESS